MGLTKIEWTSIPRKDGTSTAGYTANLWHGCTEVHEGCSNCYARVQNHHWHPENSNWGNDAPRLAIKSVCNDLERYQKNAKSLDEKHLVFVGSMMDIFEKPMPLMDSKGALMEINTGDLRNKFFANIDAGLYPNLHFLLLTKRETNINTYIPDAWKLCQPSNVIYGVSAVNQPTFDRVTNNLKKVNGKKFLSIEPQLDLITLGNLTGIDWIIEGGESGHHKRPFDVEWARCMRDECAALGIPYFFKQIDKIKSIPDDLDINEFPDIFQL